MRRGFTLIELLLVIGIIAILIAMLFPTISKSREQAKAVQCASQLRQLGQAIQNYATNNQGNTPMWSGTHTYPDGGSSYDDPGLGWTERLIPYFARPDSPVYSCPSSPAERRINYFLESHWMWIAQHKRSMQISQMKLSAQFVLSGDCTAALWYPPPFGNQPGDYDDCDKDDATRPTLLFASDPGGLSMHRGGNNVLFADDHVDLFPRFDPGRITFNPHKPQAWADVTPED